MFPWPDPGYEYPPDPEIRFRDERRDDGGDLDNDDDDADNDGDDSDASAADANSKRDNRNCLTSDKSTNIASDIELNSKYLNCIICICVILFRS